MQEKRGCGIVDISKDGPFLESIFSRLLKENILKKQMKKQIKKKKKNKIKNEFLQIRGG